MYRVQSLSGHPETQRSSRENEKEPWLDTYEIELEHPELAGMPDALEKIGSQLYGMTSD